MRIRITGDVRITGEAWITGIIPPEALSCKTVVTNKTSMHNYIFNVCL